MLNRWIDLEEYDYWLDNKRWEYQKEAELKIKELVGYIIYEDFLEMLKIALCNEEPVYNDVWDKLDLNWMHWVALTMTDKKFEEELTKWNEVE